MTTSSTRAYATGCVTLPQATTDTYLCRRHSNIQRKVWLSLCGVFRFWCKQGFVWAPQASQAGVGFDSKCLSPLLSPFWGFSFALVSGVFFLVGPNILLWMVVQHWVVILEFLLEKMSSNPSTLPSCMPQQKKWSKHSYSLFGLFHNVILLEITYKQIFIKGICIKNE